LKNQRFEFDGPWTSTTGDVLHMIYKFAGAFLYCRFVIGRRYLA